MDEISFGFDNIAENRIKDAIADGLFSGLAGEGKPLPLGKGAGLGSSDWMGQHLLHNADVLPEWLMLGKDVEAQKARFRAARADAARFVEGGAETGEWHRLKPALRSVRQRIEREGIQLRNLQDRRNTVAPGPFTQVATVWVEYHLERFDQSLLEAGAPEALLSA